MITLLIAALIFTAAAAVRWYLDRSSRTKTHHCRGLVELTSLWNRGAAFALPISRNLVGAASAVALMMVWLERKRSRLGAGLVLGGGAANLYERVCHSRVYDYVRFPHFPGNGKRYVFNLADFSIFLGAALLLLGRKKRGTAPKSSQFRP